MEVPELSLSECESVFVRDEFYENIQAPKFHDFCSNEDPVTDVDAYFRQLSGKSPRQSADPFGDQNAFKRPKETTVLKPPGLPKAPLSSMTLNADVTSTVPKASAAGLKKAKPAVPMFTPLTKSQDKAPSKNKIYQRMSPLSNASMPSPASDGKVIDFVHAPSAVKSHQASENSDPNGNSHGGLREGARRKVVNGGGSKSDEASVLTVAKGAGSVRTSTQNACDSKDTSENMVLTRSQSQIPKPPKEKSESVARRIADSAAIESSEPKDRKRKPILRTAEAGVSKLNELKARVLKQQRKSSTFSDSDSCSGVSDIGTSSFRTATTICNEPVPAPSVKGAADRRTTRRSSDNSRRRRSSGGIKTRQGRRALLRGPNSNLIAPPETSGQDETKVSLSSPMKFGSVYTSKQLCVTEEPTVVTNEVAQQGASSSPALVSPGANASSTGRIHATEDTTLNSEVNLSSNSRLSYAEALSGSGAPAPQSVQTTPCIPDESMIPNEDEGDCSVGDLLSEKLQSLQLQQEDSEASKGEVSKNVADVLQPVSHEISSENAPMVEEVKEWTGSRTNGLKENSEELTPAENLNVQGVGVPTCTDLNVCQNEEVSNATVHVSVVEVIPGEAQEELQTTDSIRSLDIELSVDESKSNLCQATISAECMVVDQYDVIESLQNLQIQQRPFSTSNVSKTSESQLQCDEDTVAVSDGDSSLAVQNKPSDKICAPGKDEELSLECHAVVPPVERKIAASFTQEFKNGNETRSLKRLLSKGPSREAHDRETERSNPKGPHTFMDNQQKRNNKRKSIELGPHRTEQKLVMMSTIHADEQRKAKMTSQSALAPLSHSQLSSSVSRVAVPSSISGQHKKMKTTCPQPFRLRTEERGALKEVEFNKKVELYLSAKEKMQNAHFQFTTNKDARIQSTVKPPRMPSKETKTSVKQVLQHTQARAGERAQFSMQVTEKSIRADEEKQEKEKRMQQDSEEEIKRMRKQMVPHAQKMPFFDRPFKPHRSTKTLTVPSSPKFHLKVKKTCARTSAQE